MPKHLGRLEPRYQFLLNPHAEYRASKCPQCERPTYPRKFPLLIHVDPDHLFVLGKTGPYCPRCELIIAHQADLEAELAITLAQFDPAAIGRRYLVIGTVDRRLWKAGLTAPTAMAATLAKTADFKGYLTLNYFPGGWYREEQRPEWVREQEQKERQRPKT